MTNKKLTPPLKWHGGKHYLAKRIIELFPPHVHYVEPYFGGGSVLLQKDPEGVSEVANDVDFELANFWATLAEPSLAKRMIEAANNTPFCEAIWKNSNNSVVLCWPDWQSALKFFIRVRQSRQGLQRDFATLSRNRTRGGMNEQVNAFLSAVDGLPDVHARLRRVVVVNRDALDVIAQQDGANTLFYLDPPYLHETRSTTGEYAHEMSREQHGDLLDLIKNAKGAVALSGYPSELYDTALSEWKRHDFAIDNKASGGKVKQKKTECVWCNF